MGRKVTGPKGFPESRTAESDRREGCRGGLAFCLVEAKRGNNNEHKPVKNSADSADYNVAVDSDLGEPVPEFQFDQIIDW